MLPRHQQLNKYVEEHQNLFIRQIHLQIGSNARTNGLEEQERGESVAEFSIGRHSKPMIYRTGDYKQKS